MKKNYFYVRYDEFLSKDETFLHIKYKTKYLSIPLKSILSYGRDGLGLDMIVHEKIFNDIVNKSSESQNNLRELYF